MVWGGFGTHGLEALTQEMKYFIFLVVLASVADVLVLAAPKDEEVKNLPGLTWKPNFKHYSGYLEDSPHGYIHYWMVESVSSPSKDPLVVWINDGIGCSSMIGMMAEHGPFSLQQDGKTIKKNPYSWNAHANIIYLELPEQTGFSHRTGAIGDVETGRAIFIALKEFYTKFPEYKTNDLYMAVEGYSSIYALYAANYITESPLSDQFKGYVMYQGAVPYKYYLNGFLYSVYYRGIIGQKEFNRALEECCGTLETSSCDFEGRFSFGSCPTAIGTITKGFDFFNQYNFLLPVPDGFATYEGCQERKLDYMTAYFSQSPVIDALHVSADKKWSPTNVDGYTIDGTDEDLIKYFRKAIATKRVLMMYGDQSPRSTSLGAEWYLDSLDLTPTEERQFWTYKEADGTKQIGGVFIGYGNTTFYTIIGAGQRIARDAPVQAFKLFDDFITGKNKESCIIVHGVTN